MFAIIISPFWLAISVVYFGLGAFHLRLSKWGSNAPTVPGKNELFSGRLTIFLESEFIRTANLTKMTLKFAAAGFFIASAISFFQSASVDQTISVDSLLFVITLAAFFVVLVVVWRLVVCVDSRIREKTNQVTLPWMWYDKKRGNTFDRVREPSWQYFEAKVGSESVLLTAACFKVPPYIKKFPVDPKEGITLKEKVSGELTVSEESMVEDKQRHVITAMLSDASLELLEQAYQLRLTDITIAEPFEDRATHNRVWWELSNLEFIAFEKSSKKFSFKASVKLLLQDTSTPPQPSFGLCVEKESTS
jgi:hypothetical protein